MMRRGGRGLVQFMYDTLLFFAFGKSGFLYAKESVMSGS